MNSQSNEEIKFYHKNQPAIHDPKYYAFANFAEGYPINFPLISGYENLQGP